MNRRSPLWGTVALFVAWAANLMADDLRVGTWNLEWFPGRSPSPKAGAAIEQFKAASDQLRAINPDIFITQEITDAETLGRLCETVTNLHLHVTSAFKDSSGPPKIQQVAIASKLPAHSAWYEPWQATTVTPPRGFSFAALDLGSNRLLGVYSVHLKSNRTGKNSSIADVIAMREESMRQLTGHVAHVSARFTNESFVGFIVAGDFNTNRENPELQKERTLDILESAGFTNTWGTTAAADRRTWRGNDTYPPCTFDYIFVRGIGAKTSQVLPGLQAASDHRPTVLRVSP